VTQSNIKRSFQIHHSKADSIEKTAATSNISKNKQPDYHSLRPSEIPISYNEYVLPLSPY
jgi:hypothetical protein